MYFALFLLLLFWFWYNGNVLKDPSASIFSHFVYTPKNMRELYKYNFADGGIAVDCPANTKKAYRNALEKGFDLAVDVYRCKDSIVCLSNPYTIATIGVPGNIKQKLYEEIMFYYILDSNERISKLAHALKLINGEHAILINVKGKFDEKYQEYLSSIIANYEDSKVYFRTSNLVTFSILKKLFKDKVVFSYIPFRKKLTVLEPKKLKKLSIPNWSDIIFSLEENDFVESILKKLWGATNKLKSRLEKDHPLFTKPTIHRAAITSKLRENSKEAIELCSRFGFNIELDLCFKRKTTFLKLFNCFIQACEGNISFSELKPIFISFIKIEKEIRIYHSDFISNMLGQEKSCCKKVKKEDSLLLDEVLSIVNGRSYLIFDIKRYALFHRWFARHFMKCLSGYSGDFCIWSFNFLLLRYFSKKHPNIIRGQVGNSVSSLKGRLRKTVANIITFLFFYTGSPDVLIYDLDKFVYLFSKFQKTIGYPTAGYSAKCYSELKPYCGHFPIFICEDVLNRKAWGSFFDKYITKEQRKMAEQFIKEHAA